MVNKYKKENILIQNSTNMPVSMKDPMNLMENETKETC